MNKDDVLLLPEISRLDVKWLWQSNYWDGVLSGLLLYNGKKYWFSCFDEAIDHAEWILSEDTNKPDISPSEQMGWWRRFAIIDITSEQLEETEYWHSLFETYVGVHCSYDENEKTKGRDFQKYIYRGIPCALGMVDPNKYGNLFYKMSENSYKNKIDFHINDGKVIGWFHE